MDGNYSGTLEPRLAACDTVIFLDLPPLTCMWRVVRRAVKYRNQTRPDMANGCQEQLDLEFLLWIWNYRRRTRPKIVRMLSERGESVKVIWLQSSAQVERYLEQVSNTLQPG